jgi:hypothetical protein
MTISQFRNADFADCQRRLPDTPLFPSTSPLGASADLCWSICAAGLLRWSCGSSHSSGWFWFGTSVLHEACKESAHLRCNPRATSENGRCTCPKRHKPPAPPRPDCPQLAMALTAPRLRALHRAEDIGSAFKRAVNVCQRQLVNEVLGPLVTEFVRNFGREGTTPIQRGPNASPFGRI